MTDPSSKLLKAISFASERHRDQRRKDFEESPYINHPIAVAELLADTGNVDNIDLLIAAILHDTVEDTQTSFEEVAAIFGPNICQIVAEVTDDKSLPKPNRKQLQIENAPKKSKLAKQLKTADKTCNIRDLNSVSPVGWPLERKIEYLDWAEKVIAGCRGVNSELDEAFDQAVADAHARLS